MVRKLIVCFVAFCSVLLPVLSQDQDSTQVKNTIMSSSGVITSDTVKWIGDTIGVDKSTENLVNNVKIFKPDSKKAVIYSAIFPGLGQIYNRKYWKLPIVYGGFVGLVYAITWNGKNYNDYTQAYFAIMSDNPLDPEMYNKWSVFFTPGAINPNTVTQSDLTRWQGSFRSKRNYFRRNRDLAIIGAVALYALCMIDAYVDAELYDFDITPDLSFRVEPKIETDVFSRKAFGIQLSVKF